MTADQRARKDRRADALDSVIDTLTKVRKRISLVDQRMDDMSAGWPSHKAGGGETHDGEAMEYRSSTEANALNPGRDVVGPDKRRRDQLLLKLTVMADELDEIDRKYLGGADGTQPPDPPGCEIVGRIVGKDGKRAWEPVYAKSTGKMLANGPWPEPKAVGKWAHDFMTRTGREPYRREIEAHLQGRAVKAEPVDTERPAPVRRGWRSGASEAVA